MRIKLVSTFSDAGYESYGKKFVSDLERFLDKRIQVSLYVDTAPVESKNNIKVYNLSTAIPKTLEFKNRNYQNSLVDEFKYNAVRFCYKVYVMCHESVSDADYLIWLDADTRFLKPVTQEYLFNFLPQNNFLSYLGRKGTTETGFLMFDLRNYYRKDFFDRFAWYYDSDEVFKLKEHHDAWVFDVVRKEFESDKRIETHSITPHIPLKHPFNLAFENHMMHLKGTMKVKIPKALRNEK